MELAFNANVVDEVVVEIGRTAIDAIGKLVGVGGGKATADLEISGAGGGGPGL